MSLNNHIDPILVKSTFARYGLGNINGEPEQIQGDVDYNYKITSDNGNVYLLKRITNPSHIDKFEFLGNLHEYLQTKNIVVPKYFRAKNKRFVEDNFILYGFIEGEIKKEWTDKEIASLVINFANLLIALKEYEVPDFVKNNTDKYMKGYNIAYCHDVFKPQIFELNLADDIKNPIIETVDLLYSKLPDFEKLPKQLIHGDLNEMNAIFKDGVNVGIIDFGVSYDPVVYDLGEFCYWFAFPWWTEDFNHDRYNHIRQQFEKKWPLSALEKKLLPYMILRRSMMDIMLTLQYYWSNQTEVQVPAKRLAKQVVRNSKIIEKINHE
jgi:Ser/Thr protein kinase RdoA (MazF antagonist)